jgi:hypothetical protein
MDKFTVESYQIFKEEITLMLLNLFHNKKERNTLKLILWSQYYPDTNPDKDIAMTKEENYTNILNE